MSNKLKLNRMDGFTIVEVIIVLVIAGVIMLAVFLVVPQLQQTSRNSRQSDNARRLLAAVQQFVANNNGKFPSAAGDNVTLLGITNTMTNPKTNQALTTSNVTFGKSLTSTDTAVGPTMDATTVGNLWYYENAACNTGGKTTTYQAGSYAVIVSTEPGGAGFCQNT